MAKKEKPVKNYITITENEDGTLNIKTDIEKAVNILGLLEFAKINIFTYVSKNNTIEKFENKK